MIHCNSALRVETPMSYPTFGRTGCTVMMAVMLGACATGSKPVNQEVSLRTTQGGERIEATCDVGNDWASWTVVSPAIIGVTRSEKPLTVECRTTDGSEGIRTFDAIKFGDLPGAGAASYGYPPVLELELTRAGKSRAIRVSAPSFAPIDAVGKVPQIGDEGREGYRRFLAGDTPRAFAISDSGNWVRVNAVRGASRVAIERCQSYGGRCRLYAVDDQVVWEPDDPELVAAY
jgi:hypothetical protein